MSFRRGHVTGNLRGIKRTTGCAAEIRFQNCTGFGYVRILLEFCSGAQNAGLDARYLRSFLALVL